MSAAPRTVSTAPDLRQLGLALGAVLVAVAIVALVAFARAASTNAPSAAAAPASQFDHDKLSAPAAPAPQFDHDKLSAPSNSKSLIISGTKGGGIMYTGIPYQAVHKTVTVRGTQGGGGIVYTGIPYTAPDSTPTQVGRGTRFAR